MFHRSLLLVLAACAATLCGCDQAGGGASRGGVAIVDLDKVALATGHGAAIDQALQTMNQQTSTRIDALRNELQNKVQQQASQFGAQPTPQQQEQINRTRQEAQQQFSREIGEAQQRMDQLRQSLIQRFRDQVRPIAGQVAAQRGLSVVMIRQDAILDFDASVDITEDVITAMAAAGPAAAPPTTMPAPPMGDMGALPMLPPLPAPTTRPAPTQPSTRPATQP